MTKPRIPSSWPSDGETKFYDLDGERILNTAVVFKSRINGDGLSFVECEPFGVPGWFKVFCLSISNKRWIATNGMSTYIVELMHNEPK